MVNRCKEDDMDETTVCIIARSCSDILKALTILDKRIPIKKRAKLHLFIAFKLRDIIVAVGESADIDSELKNELSNFDF